ncbi:hypothetical protein MPTK1_4g21950 [Marchantia polymorpha subsp. ruderalis]|uniref:Uncharacterized protein n=2 Tax=Marchantia polymorpha TaxID=3197 RepID=A0AAF6BCG6_MARPO|nr:hypothetical protein MARPO_0090s0027 [Marchantia polymorpha]BBN09700.1 hypothetical protein Mp_4g21950 [Marchantia polymorpha subsp. ruderalis]|eukprot:PTQ33286.1 hypothetical protein MARPO_0090s0027 [Marchantia polymorpha]
MQKRVAIGGFITIWAIALQAHMMWLKRQDAFKQKFGDEPIVVGSSTMNSTLGEQDQLQSSASSE